MKTGSCSTKPRSVWTGPPWKTGASPSSGRARCSSIFSKSTLRLMSLGLLITSPSAPRSLCSQRYTTLRLKVLSSIPGIAIKK
ncbi:Uncharacterised protein [Mycobacterium tuberculosis]|nr:Uncharacterised protein [Mycobacterium tuberculosis]